MEKRGKVGENEIKTRKNGRKTVKWEKNSKSWGKWLKIYKKSEKIGIELRGKFEKLGGNLEKVREMGEK